MDTGERLALSRYWWTSEAKQIHKAVEAGQRLRWRPAVDAALRRNAAAKQLGTSCRRPSCWSGLAVLNRFVQNIDRIAKGQHAATKEFLLGVASILNLATDALYPDTCEWVAGATHYLCMQEQRAAFEAEGRKPADAYERARASTASLGESHVYARFMLDHPPTDGAMHEEDIEADLLDLPPDKRAVVRKVAAQLAPALERIEGAKKTRKKASDA
jgi:hypothetical protein